MGDRHDHPPLTRILAAPRQGAQGAQGAQTQHQGQGWFVGEAQAAKGVCVPIVSPWLAGAGRGWQGLAVCRLQHLLAAQTSASHGAFPRTKETRHP
jgi:hypothetical protein